MSAPGRLRVAIAAGALVLVLGLALAAGWLWRELHRPYAGWDGGEVVVVLDPGLHAGQLLSRLATAGVLKRPRLARAWLSWNGGAERLRAGEYRFDAPVSTLEVLNKLEQGQVLLHPVTVPEGLTRRETALRLVEAGFGPLEELVAAFDDPALIRDLDPEAEDLEGYLFPDTYHFPRGAPARSIAETFVEHFRSVAGPEIVTEAETTGLGVRRMVTLASMIEKETSLSEERERISQVFHNRLERGMRLECDPTVIYALERAGRNVGRLTYADLRFDSPWNTYVIHGLPRGPIASPGRESLLASLRPSEGKALYFVASPDGGHHFSDSHAAHLQAVAVWRRYVRSSR